MDLTYSDKSHSYKELRFNNLEYVMGEGCRTMLMQGELKKEKSKAVRKPP